MTLTVEQARDEMLTLFKTAWDAQGAPVPALLYDDTDADLPAPTAEWARVQVIHGPSSQTTLADGTGKKRYTRTGLVWVQIFTPNSGGLARADVLTKIALDAFEGKKTPGGAWFKNVSSNEAGKDGSWARNDVRAEFEYDEVK